MSQFEGFRVHIPANVYDGKYYDYRTHGYIVYKGFDGVETEEDAIAWVNSHKDQVLSELDNTRVSVGGRGVRKFPKPIEKNVFFNDKYTTSPVKGLISSPDSKPRANRNGQATQPTEEIARLKKLSGL